MSRFDYDPPPTLKRFHQSDARLRFVRGPVGSAKSSAMVMELLRRACETPKDVNDGIRRSKFVITRNTLQQLKTTCWITVQQLIRPIVKFKVSDQTIQLRLPGVESDWILLPLDTPENVDRLLSLELTGVWASEFRELDPQLVADAYSRCGRYPSPKNLRQEDRHYWYGLIAETNSFSADSPWYEKLEEALPANWDYFVQPGAFEPDAENRENLPSRYYEDLIEANDEAWCEQYIHNRITPSLSGQAVFKNAFIPDFHVAEESLTPIPGHPLIIGMDTGRNPAAVICQLDGIGRLLVLDEIHAANMGMTMFLDQKLTPLLGTPRFAGLSGYLVLDPICVRRSEVGEESVLSACRDAGYQAVPAQTNNIAPRLRAVDKFLNKQAGGKAAILFDPVYCKTSILCMQSKYRYKRKKDKTLEDKPEKLHPYSDLMDSLQYACLGTDTRLRGRVFRQTPSTKPSQPSVAGWT